MSTSNVNAVTYGAICGQGFFNLPLPCDNSVSAVNQGDLVYWDSSAKIVKPIASDANAQYMAGIALDPSIVSSNLDNSGAPIPTTLAVGYGVLAKMKTTNAESYITGAKVYIGADAQTVTTVAGSYSVGTVVLPPSAVPGVAVTGGTGVTVQILVHGRSFGTLV